MPSAGDVVLRQVKLRRDALKFLNLPVDVTAGMRLQDASRLSRRPTLTREIPIATLMSS